jgi:hypothetical protein
MLPLLIDLMSLQLFLPPACLLKAYLCCLLPVYPLTVYL